jgi:hypothetical protein
VCRICGSSSRPGTKASRTRSKSNQSVTTTASGKLPCARHTAGHSSMLQSPVFDAYGHASALTEHTVMQGALIVTRPLLYNHARSAVQVTRAQRGRG